jgi:ubiquinone/menaquinone biosynthesis C-methylase UbiE
MSPACHICSGNRATLYMQKDGSDYYRCPDCRLEFIFPQPDDEALARIYSENYYDAWGLNIDSDTTVKLKRSTFEYRLNLISENLKPGDNILDCGCATGIFLDLVKEQGFVPYGVEISDYGVQECRKKFGEQNIFHGQLEDARFGNEEKNFISAIFMTDYLEHVRNPHEVLVTACRFLKPGGLLVITTPDTSSISNLLMRKNWIHYKTEHLFYFSRANIELLLSQAGCTIMQKIKGWKYFSWEYVSHQFNAYPVPVLSLAVRVINKILPVSIRKKRFCIHAGEMIVVARKLQSEKE